MKKQTNREFVYENIVKMIQTGNYDWDKLETIEPDSMLNDFVYDDLDQLDFFMRLIEFFGIDMKELEKRWDEIDTIDELCNHIVVLMNKKQKEQIEKNKQDLISMMDMGQIILNNRMFFTNYSNIINFNNTNSGASFNIVFIYSRNCIF